jgi:hypothetical protein
MLGDMFTGVQLGRMGTVVNNYNYVTTAGPTVQIDAKYAQVQSPAQIRDDLRLALDML